MNRTEIVCVLNRLGVVAVLLGLTTFPTQAQTVESSPECANSDFRGEYALYRNGFVGVDQSRQSVVSLVRADGEGMITMWKTWGVSLREDEQIGRAFVGDEVERAAFVGSKIEYTVEPDCSITVSQPTPQIEFEYSGVIFNGGRDIYWNITGPPSLAGGSITLRRTDAFGAQLEEQVQRNTGLLKQIARRMSIRVEE